MDAWYLTRFGILGKVQLVEVQYILQDVVDGFCAHVLQHGIGSIGHSAAYHIPPVLQDELVEDDFRQLLYGLQVVNVLKGSLVRRAFLTEGFHHPRLAYLPCSLQQHGLPLGAILPLSECTDNVSFYPHNYTDKCGFVYQHHTFLHLIVQM